MPKFFYKKNIFITGSCGSIGKELIKQLLSNSNDLPNRIIGIDINESGLFFQEQDYVDSQILKFYLADIRDFENLTFLMRDTDFVFHCAAFKHVILCERSPEQAIQNNIIGTKNVIRAAQLNNVERVLFTSSDKAVNPTNVMGTSKLMGERMMTAANAQKKNNYPIFASTRFGNVLGSNGSVVPIFHNQIMAGGPVTLTSFEMTRFVMSLNEAVILILQSIQIAKGGEVFVTKMPVLSIANLAHAMIEELGPKYAHKPNKIKITEIGTKPGEKNYEELLNLEESRRTLELKSFFSILPAFRGIYSEIDYNYVKIVKNNPISQYISSLNNALDISKTKKLLKNYKVLENVSFDKNERYWPGDKEEKRK